MYLRFINVASSLTDPKTLILDWRVGKVRRAFQVLLNGNTAHTIRTHLCPREGCWQGLKSAVLSWGCERRHSPASVQSPCGTTKKTLRLGCSMPSIKATGVCVSTLLYDLF